MYIKLIIIAIVLLAVVMLAFGIRLLLDRNATFKAPTCALENGNKDALSCDRCGLTDLSHCPVKKEVDEKHDNQNLKPE